MKIYIKLFLIFICVLPCSAQYINEASIDSLYKEDQFYVGVTYNLIGKKPSGLSQNRFSTGLHLGFINDIPFNEKRNFGIGIGLGYSLSVFNQNMQISKIGENFNYVITEGDAFSKNKFVMHQLELPFEFRLRTSNPNDYKFWRIYTGIKFGYTVYNVSKFKGDSGTFSNSNIKDFNNFNYGLTLSAGYNTWNVFLYYGLDSIFNENAQINDQKVKMNAIKIGLMFYIL